MVSSPASGIQIAHLRAFLAVRRLGSYSRAAEELCYTEPAVHLQVSVLRKVSGDPLFERNGPRMTLTPRGEQLLPLAKAAVEAFDALVEASSMSPPALEVGLGRLLGSYVFPPVAALFEQSAGIELHQHILPASEMIEAVRRGRLDIGIAGGLDVTAYRGADSNGEPTVLVPWRRYNSVLVTSPQVQDSLVQPGGSLALPIIVPLATEPYSERLQRALQRIGLTAKIIYVENGEAAKAAAVAGLGIAKLPEYAVPLQLAAGELAVCFPELLMPASRLYLMHLRPARRPAVAMLVRFLRQLNHDYPDLARNGIRASVRPVTLFTGE